MQKLSDKKIKIISRSGQSVSGPLAPKKEPAFFGFFTTSRTETLGKNTSTVFKEPVLKSPPSHVPEVDLAAIKRWVALEEKIVHDCKEKKPILAKSAASLSKTSAKQPLPEPSKLNNQEKKASSPAVSKKRFTLFGFFNTPRTETLGKNTSTVLKEPVLKSPTPHVPEADLAVIKSWVALEEKIVHDYKEKKPILAKSAASLSKTSAKQPLPEPSKLNNQEKKASSPAVSKKRFTLFGFFNTPRTETLGKNTSTVLKEPVLKSPTPHVPEADLAVIKSWVAPDEKIVHDYKEKKPILPKGPANQSHPAAQIFTARSAVSLSSSVSKPKDLLRDSKRVFAAVSGFLWVCGWLAAAVFTFLYAQETFLSRENAQKLSQLQEEKIKLEQSYARLKSVSEKQRSEMKWLNNQLHDMAFELKMAKADRVAYESELAALQDRVQTQDAVVNALKAQSQAFENIIEQAGMSSLSGAAAGLSQKPFSEGGPFAVQAQVISVDGHQNSVVTNLGAGQGASYGRRITISRSGIALAGGRIERVYPTMSVAVFRDAGMLKTIREGDSVSFS